MPIIVTAGRPARNSPMMAMTTVVPANSTAWPAVAFAVPAASATLMPSCRCWRCRVTMKRA